MKISHRDSLGYFVLWASLRVAIFRAYYSAEAGGIVWSFCLPAGWLYTCSNVDQTWQASATGDHVELVNFWCWSGAWCGSDTSVRLTTLIRLYPNINRGRYVHASVLSRLASQGPRLAKDKAMAVSYECYHKCNVKKYRLGWRKVRRLQGHLT